MLAVGLGIAVLQFLCLCRVEGRQVRGSAANPWTKVGQRAQLGPAVGAADRSTVAREVGTQLALEFDLRDASGASAQHTDEHLTEGGGHSGEFAHLTKEGYEHVVKLHSDKDMMTFVWRLASREGYTVTDKDALKRIIPYYSGHKGEKSFGFLAKEVRKAAWVTSFGQTQEFNEMGYQRVAKLKDDDQMGTYMRRYVKSLGRTIVNETSFEMFVPYFSGTTSKHSLQAAREEILGLRSAVYEQDTDLGGPALNKTANPPRHAFGAHGEDNSTAVPVSEAAADAGITLNPGLIAFDAKCMLGVVLVLVAGKLLNQFYESDSETSC